MEKLRFFEIPEEQKESPVSHNRAGYKKRFRFRNATLKMKNHLRIRKWLFIETEREEIEISFYISDMVS